MSKKDYEAVADLIYKNFTKFEYKEDSAFQEGYERALEDVAYGLAEIFARENERFETQRFLNVCGV